MGKLENESLFKEIDSLDEWTAEQVFWVHKWHDGEPHCPKCGSDKWGRVVRHRCFRCKECGREYTSKSQTLFASSTLTFRQCLKAICLADEADLTRKRVREVVGVSNSGVSLLLPRIQLLRATGSIADKDLLHRKR